MGRKPQAGIIRVDGAHTTTNEASATSWKTLLISVNKLNKEYK